MRLNVPSIARLTLVSGLFLRAVPPASLHAQTTVIISCVSKLSGVSRIVAAPSACNAAVENVVMWNQQGQTGPQGPVGPTGAAGARGPQGLTGARGPTGVTGPQGPQGATGATGTNGTNGTNGAGYAASSTSFQPLDLGTRTFTVPAGLAYVSGDYIRATDSVSPTYYLEGTVASYSGTTLVMNATLQSAAAAQHPYDINAWAFSIAGTPGATGVQGAAGPAGPTGPQGVPGATGAMGLQGARGLQGLPGREGLPGQTGPQGPAGPTGPQGPAGPSSGLAYTIHFYGRTVTIPGRSKNDVSVSESAVEVCNKGEIGIAASCGFQNTTATADQFNVIVNYQGLDTDNLNAGLCLMSNTDTGARTTTVGVSCLAPADTGTSAGKVVKSCTYDPDTQTPCTEADATVFDPVADKAQALARVSALNAAGPAVSSTDGTPKVKRSVTLWFRD